ncbi:MAG: hypothetical protein HOY75_09610 [Streptomyces sp.]|nr:hypothetical protein [Streptomyces sp.]
MTARLEILGDDGQWHEVPGIASVEFDEVQYDPRDEAYRRHDALDAAAYSTTAFTAFEITITPQLRQLQEEFERAEAAMRCAATRRPRVIDQDGRPVRPAWQSPYGPPPRRP